MYSKNHGSKLKVFGLGIMIALGTFMLSPASADITGFPAAAWHRGNVSVAQENSLRALRHALMSPSPHIEVDILDFIDATGRRIGLLSHDYGMERITGSTGKFIDHKDIEALPRNTSNPDLSGEPFVSVIDLFMLIREVKASGTTPMVSLDMKEEGSTGKAFGIWVGDLIEKHGFEAHVFASSFFKSNVQGVKEGCQACLTGGVLYKDHFALQYLNPKFSSLDLTAISRATFLFGFWGKDRFQHDFVLIQDEILFSDPGIITYWKNQRNVKFVGGFASGGDTPYSENEWDIMLNADWLELEPSQMRQWLMHQNKHDLTNHPKKEIDP